jgi:hypothetical protein
MRMCVVKYGRLWAVMFASFFLLGVAGKTPAAAASFVGSAVSAMIRSSTESSSWKRCRLFTIKREKSLVPNCPDTTGSTNGRQSRIAQLLKLMRSRPVCFARESTTPLQASRRLLVGNDPIARRHLQRQDRVCSREIVLAREAAGRSWASWRRGL